MHISAVTMQSLGNNRQQRNETFMSAVISRKGAEAIRRVATLVEMGIDVNHRDEYGMTALMWASWLNHVSIVKILLNAGSDINALDPLGRSALNMAALRPDSEQIFQIIQQFACDHNLECLSTIDSMQNLQSDNDDRNSHYVIYDGLSMAYKRHCKVSFNSSMMTTTGSVGDAYMLIPPLLLEPYVPDWSSFKVHGVEDGAYCIDNAFSKSFLNGLLDIFHNIPIALSSTKLECASSRSYFCDISGKVCVTIASVVREALVQLIVMSIQQHYQINSSLDPLVKLFPQMRFLHYSVDGSSLDPHVDLSRVDVTSDEHTKSTHTAILYLTDCTYGGGTALLRHLRRDDDSRRDSSQCFEVKEVAPDSHRAAVVATVCPRVGRLLIFPHNCPHEGLAVYATAPKILLRGEISISYSQSRNKEVVT